MCDDLAQGGAVVGHFPPVVVHLDEQSGVS